MIGLDYGVKPNMMILGDCEFPQLITDAVIAGLGYISIPLDSNDSTQLKIAVIFKDAIKGNKVMDRFLNWIKLSNGNMNAFGLDIIEKNDGSYLLCIYQEQKILLERLIPREIKEWVNPLLSVVVHYKCIDRRSEQYYMFKKACKFNKCHIYGADITGRILSFNKVIIKENIKFYKEDDITEDSFLYSFKPRDSFSFNKKYISNLDNNTEVINVARVNNIKYFFPVTYNEIVNCGYFKVVLEELEARFDKSIIIQAICNIVLEYRISEDKVELNKKSVIEWIEYIVNNYETPKSKFPEDKNYTIDDVLQQIIKDEEYLKSIKGGI
ncbi:hypothetical protein [Clostridium chrysemydis]|uniref:hypothetical protein n=1 Tax=Clostridium chrysemydis TaxID=2665504 RepID=UPI003F36E674